MFILLASFYVQLSRCAIVKQYEDFRMKENYTICNNSDCYNLRVTLACELQGICS